MSFLRSCAVAVGLALLPHVVSCSSTPHDSAESLGEVRSALVDTSTPAGTWYLNANGSRLELLLQTSSSVPWSGQIKNEGGSWEPLSSITWNATTRFLEFRRNGPGFYQWYRASVTFGVMNGRFSHGAGAAKPALTSYASHVTGWSPTQLDTNIVPRTWKVNIGDFRGVLRVDTNSTGTLEGRLKVYGQAIGAPPDELSEELEADLSDMTWNGSTLTFTRTGPGFTQLYSGTVSGRSISGVFFHNGTGPFAWNGTRAEVTGFGLGSRLPNRTTWQEQTRARIVNLTEGMRVANSAIPSISVFEEACIGCPVAGGYPADRDDNATAWPQSGYTLKRLRFEVSPGSRFDPANPPPTRIFRGYLATPTWAMPPGGFRAVVAVNGHNGTARKLMTPSDVYFWHGDSAARRGLIVLAIDIGHNPPGWGWDDPNFDPIVDAGYADSNWEEDGERAFSVRRAIDWLASQPNVRASRIMIQGISMGGEVSTIVAGLDPRISFAMVAGYSPDMYVMDLKGNDPCYRWKLGDIHEYLDVSDFEALTAPRPLLVETGKVDFTFSLMPQPFAADKQVTRRARAAYGTVDAPKLVHYLHYDEHHFHVGDIHPASGSPGAGVQEVSQKVPFFSGDQLWQTDPATFTRSPTLYHLMNELVP